MPYIDDAFVDEPIGIVGSKGVKQAIDREYPHGFWFDVSVTQASLDAYVADVISKVRIINSCLNVFVMGHLGDGNLHLTISSGRPAEDDRERVAEAVYAGLAEIGGSFSAEHGIGTEKKDALSRRCDPVKLELMRTIKRALDPKGIMNPGKVI